MYKDIHTRKETKNLFLQCGDSYPQVKSSTVNMEAHKLVGTNYTKMTLITQNNHLYQMLCEGNIWTYSIIKEKNTKVESGSRLENNISSFANLSEVENRLKIDNEVW